MTDILMAVYNGEKYLRRQIDSILNQSCDDWRLFISDDMSADGSAAILREYQNKYPDKIFVEYKKNNSGSPAANFFDMLSKSNADFILTADQDDVWERNKVKITVEALKSYPSGIPLLVHTDLTVADDDLNVISPSMCRMQHLPVNKTALNNMIVQNIVTGCTMGINRALADIIVPTEKIPVHDWWIACTAALFGKIVYLPQSTILYRQHGANACGAQNMESAHYYMDRIKGGERSKYMLELGYIIAGELLEKYDVKGKNAEMLAAYASLRGSTKLKKLAVICRYGIWKSGIARKIGQLIFM